MLTQKYCDELTYQIIGCAIEVHKELGPGLLESIYEKCFVEEIIRKRLCYVRQMCVPIVYKEKTLDADLRLDLLIEDLIVVELKSVEALHPLHEAQLLTYMKLLQKPKGVLINFNCTHIFSNGQKTMVNDLYSGLPKT